MYRIDRNNYNLKPKNSTIYTPKEVSEFIFELLSPHFYQEYDYDHSQAFQKSSLILDPCSGMGSLLEPWKNGGYETLEIDISKENSADIQTDFLILEKWEWKKPNLILCNPPFNGYYPKLAGEVFFDQIIKLFGLEIPLVLFTPLRLRLCSQKNSPRYQKWTNGTYPSISSIISLTTKDTFPEVDFFSEILIFNIKELEPHYFYQEKKYE